LTLGSMGLDFIAMSEEPTGAVPGDEDGMAIPRRRRERDVEVDPQATRRRMLLVFPLVAAAAGIVAVVLTGMKDNAIYSKPVDQLVAQKARFQGRAVRAEGNLVHGTLVKRDTPCEYRFTITKNGTDVPVRYAQCVVPDTFRDVPGMDVGVTVEGQLLADNSFEATTVLAKCPSKYEMKERAGRGEQMPHASLDSNAAY
jgi:cytochrome c-type biogenesis protein CcmE